MTRLPLHLSLHSSFRLTSGTIDEKKETDTVETLGLVDRGTVFLRAQGDLKPARKKKVKGAKTDEKSSGEENKFKGFTAKNAISKLQVYPSLTSHRCVLHHSMWYIS
jgi:hypothetical protein